MTTDERIDRLTGIVESLTGALGTLSATVVAHDNQIEALIKIAEQHDKRLAKLDERIDRLVREWQAYLTRIATV